MRFDTLEEVQKVLDGHSVSGPLQNAPDELLMAEQNSGGAAPNPVQAAQGNAGVTGTSGVDTIDSLGIATTAIGGGGNDTYVYNAGYGPLTVNNFDAANNGNEGVVQFGQGITASELSFSRVDASGPSGASASDRAPSTTFNDLSISVSDGSTSDTLVVSKALDPAGTGRIKGLSFADGTTLSMAQIVTKLETPSATNTSIYGTASDETFDSKGIATYEEGRGGQDTYVFHRGYGALTINNYDFGNGGTNGNVTFDASVSPAGVGVALGGAAGTDLVLSIQGTPDKVTVQDAFNASGNYAVGQIRFSDGTVWTLSQVAALVGTGTAGSDVIQGTLGNDLLDGRGGGDTISGGGGYDTYFMRQGYGTLAIDNSAPGGTVVQGEVDFGPGITEQNLWFSQSGSDLVASVLGSADAVDIKGWFGTDPSAQLAGFKAFDGMKLDGQVGQLTAAMAAYAGSNPGFNPSVATAMPADPTLQSALAAAWHA